MGRGTRPTAVVRRALGRLRDSAGGPCSARPTLHASVSLSSVWMRELMTLKEFREMLNQQQETWEVVVRLTSPSRRARTMQHRREHEAWSSRIRGIIDAMTPSEREFPFAKLDGWHVRRIARGAGVDKSEVVDLLESVKQANVMFARLRLRKPPSV